MIKKQGEADSSAIIHIRNLAVSVDGKTVLNGIDLQIAPGSVHALMGPNGAGKSSLAYTLMGHPRYKVISGSLVFRGQDYGPIATDERSRNGIFLAMQHPIEIPGLSVYTLLKEAVRARNVEGFSLIEFSTVIEQMADLLHISRAWLHRPLDSGFSGGEKKRLELLQMLVLKPTFVILDEIDSGLDVEAIVHMGTIIKNYATQNPHAGFLIMSHQKRFLDIIKPDYLHIMQQGTIIRSADYSLIDQIELGGYDAR